MEVNPSDVKQFLKIQTNDEDTILQAMIDGAVAYCETYLNRPILDKNMNTDNTWEVPSSVLIAIYLLVGTWYENRTSVAIGTTTKEIEFSTKAILQPHRFMGV